MATLFVFGGALLLNLPKKVGKKVFTISARRGENKTSKLATFGSLKAAFPWWSSFTFTSTLVFLQQEFLAVCFSFLQNLQAVLLA